MTYWASPLEVIPARLHISKKWTTGYLVYEEDGAFFLCDWWDRRLMCSCPDGQVNHEDGGLEQCPHLEAALEYRRTVEQASSRQPMKVEAGRFVD